MSASGDPAWRALAISKLTRVLGRERSEEELKLVLFQLNLPAITTIEDLEQVASALQRRPGFVATVGALLAVDVALQRLRSLPTP